MSAATTSIRWFAIGLAAAVAIVVAAVAWLVGTTSGAQWAFRQASALVDADLTAVAVDGTLARELTVTDLSYIAPDSSLEIHAETASVVVDFSELVHGVLHIENLEISGVVVSMRGMQGQDRVPAAAPKTEPLQAPIDVVVDRMFVRRAEFNRASEPLLRVKTLHLAGEWIDRRIEIKSLSMQAQQGEVVLAGHLERDTGAYAVDASGRFDWRVRQQRLAGSLDVKTQHQEVAVDIDLSAPTAADLTASIAQGARKSWSFQLTVPRFDPEFPGGAAIRSLSASLAGSGTEALGAIRGVVMINGEPLRLQPLRISRAPERLGFNAIVAIGSALGDLSVSGTIQTQAEPWRANVDASWGPLTLPQEWLDRPLRTRGDVQLRGNLQEYSLSGDVSIGPPNRMAHIVLDASGSPQRIRIAELRVRQPDGFFAATGLIQRDPAWRWDLQASAESFDPGAFLSGWSGALDLNLATRGSVTNAGPRGELSLQTLEGEIRGRPVSGSGNLLLTNEQQLIGQLQLRSGDSRIQIQADRSKPWDASVRFHIEALEDWLPRATGRVEGRLSISGEWPELDLEGSAQAKQLQAAGVSIDAARMRVDLRNLRAPSGAAHVELSDVAAGTITLRNVVADLEGSREQHVLELRASGAPASIAVRIAGRSEDIEGHQRLIETFQRASVDFADLQPLTLTEPSSVVLGPSAWSLSRTCLASPEARVCFAGEIDRGGADPANIDAELTAVLPDIAPAAVLTTHVANLHGRIELDLAIAGTTADPTVQMQLHASKLMAEIPRLGLALEEGELHATSLGGDRIAVSGKVRSGEGWLIASGTVTPTGHASIEIEGDRVLAADIAGARVVATPDLRLSRDADDMLLTGQVTIPSAQINVQQLRRVTRVKRGSEDVVIVDAKTAAESKAEAIPLRADVTVILGESIDVSGFGLQAQLGGRLMIREGPGQPTTASGEIQAEGTYQAFGQDLTIEQGSISYADTPLDNPRLNIVATRELEMEDITAGVRITGPAQTPRLSVFSDPAMDEANALSYLLAGRPLDEIGVSETEGDALSSAAQSLGTAAGGLLAKRIGERLGLDVAAVEEDEFTGAQVFTVGEYLSPRLYLGYGVGLFEAGDVITLRYRLSDDVAVRAVRGPEESRIGIEYRVEN